MGTRSASSASKLAVATRSPVLTSASVTRMAWESAPAGTLAYTANCVTAPEQADTKVWVAGP